MTVVYNAQSQYELDMWKYFLKVKNEGLAFLLGRQQQQDDDITAKLAMSH